MRWIAMLLALWFCPISFANENTEGDTVVSSPTGGKCPGGKCPPKRPRPKR